MKPALNETGSTRDRARSWFDHRDSLVGKRSKLFQNYRDSPARRRRKVWVTNLRESSEQPPVEDWEKKRSLDEEKMFRIFRNNRRRNLVISRLRILFSRGERGGGLNARLLRVTRLISRYHILAQNSWFGIKVKLVERCNCRFLCNEGI